MYVGYSLFASLSGRAFVKGQKHTIRDITYTLKDAFGNRYARVKVESGWFGVFYADDQVDCLRVGMQFTEECVGTEKRYGRTDFIVVRITNVGSEENMSQEVEYSMQGKVFIGVVVQTKTVPAGEGVVGAGVQVSEVVYSKSEPFIAPNEEIARAEVLAEAVSALKDKGFDAKDPTRPVEVRLLPFSGGNNN